MNICNRQTSAILWVPFQNTTRKWVTQILWFPSASKSSVSTYYSVCNSIMPKKPTVTATSKTTDHHNKEQWKNSKYCQKHQNVTQRHKVTKAVGKWCWQTCLMRGCHKPSICKKQNKNLSAKCNKAKHDKKRYAHTLKDYLLPMVNHSEWAIPCSKKKFKFLHTFLVVYCSIAT